MADDIQRIENKLDTVNDDVRALTAAIHEQSVSIVRLCEQMKSSTEAVGRAHSRIDGVNDKVESLRDLPTKMGYLEKQVEHHATEIETLHASVVTNSDRVGQREAVAATMQKFSPWLAIGAVVSALALLGAASRLMGN